MRIDPTLSPTPESWLAANAPDEPVFLFHPGRLMEVAREFLTGFPGLVTYAVKANPAPEMIRVLHAAGRTSPRWTARNGPISKPAAESMCAIPKAIS